MPELINENLCSLLRLSISTMDVFLVIQGQPVYLCSMFS